MDVTHTDPIGYLRGESWRGGLMMSSLRLLSLGVLLLLLTPLNRLGAAEEKILDYGVYSLPQSWDPVFGATVADTMMTVNAFEGLTSLSAQGNVVPGAARRWDISEDGLSYTFHLRPGLRWSDGSPLTAQHFANTIIRIHQGKGRNHPFYLYTPIKYSAEVLDKTVPIEALGVRVIDELTLHYELVQASPYFLELMAIASFPSHPSLHQRLAIEKPWPATEFIGNGAYQLVAENTSKQGYRLIKNPFYHTKNKVYFDTVNIHHYDNANTAFFALANGEIDAYDRYWGNQLPSVQSGPEPSSPVYMIQMGMSSVDYLTLNGQDRALKDRRIRQAMSLALDRRTIAQKLGYRDPERAVAYSLTPSMPSIGWQPLTVAWQDESLEARQEQARKLLAEAGYNQEQRLKLELLVNQGDDNEQMAEQVRQQWQAIGIDIKVIANPGRAHYREYLRKQRYQVARAGWTADYQDPLNFLATQQHKHKSNFGQWFHPDYEQTIQRLQQQVLSTEERLAAFTRLERLIQQELPVIPLYYKTSFALLGRHLAPVNQNQGTYLLWRHFRPKEGS